MDVKLPPRWLIRRWSNDEDLLELMQIPEVVTYWRLAFWNGFLGLWGIGLEKKLAAAREESFRAISEYVKSSNSQCPAGLCVKSMNNPEKRILHLITQHVDERDHQTYLHTPLPAFEGQTIHQILAKGNPKELDRMEQLLTEAFIQ